jgi:hypothetical protein
MQIQTYSAGVWNALCARRKETRTTAQADPQMKIKSLALALLLLAAAGCKTLSPGSGSADQNQPTILQVDNQGFIDMDVFTLRSSQRIRLGTAPGASKSNFTIPPSLVSGLTPLRFIADPIGGRRASVSQEITVAPGDTVVMTIPAV